MALALALLAPASLTAQALGTSDNPLIAEGPEPNWLETVEVTERGHRIGKPQAEAALIEFISYTCSHCANFVKQSGPALDLAGVGPGNISVEVRPVIRNGLDLAITMLAQCGDPKGFKARHRMFLYSQSTWLPKAMNAPQAQQAIWARADAAGRLNAARNLDLDDMLVQQQGMALQQVNACLADNEAAKAILANDEADRTEFNVTGTPTFALDGKTLEGVYSWPQLAGVLQETFRKKAETGELPTP